jgi:hypothetical protein
MKPLEPAIASILARTAALGERLVDVRLETTETLLERGLHVGEGPI